MSAFCNDPVERWLYPAADEYEQYFPTFLAAFGGAAFGRQTVLQLADFAAVALWLPPDTAPDGEGIVRVLLETVAPAKHGDVLSVLELMDAADPRYPHWYLPWFGVDAAVQGRGLGSQLMASCLDLVDAPGLPAYLETPNPRTIPFYRRHGFELTGEARAGQCPPITFMLRPAQ